MAELRFHSMPDERRIAFRKLEGAGPVIVFLPGYLSDMAGSKATALMAWAEAQGRACLLLDYSGCGESSGTFAEGSLTRWREEVAALLEAQTSGPVVLVGSSMGGWLMLLVAQDLGDRVAGLVGIAAAPDFTDWGFTPEQKIILGDGETVFEDSAYGYDPMPTHALFWRDGEKNRVLDHAIPLTCPVRLLHGQADSDVPWELSLRFAKALRSDDVQVTLVKDGDHRLSREADIALILRTIALFP